MLLRKISKDLLHPLILWRSGELDRLRFLKDLEKSQYQTAAEIRELQNDRLQQLLQHTLAHNPFYRARMLAVGIDRIGNDPREILGKLPPLTKREIQEQGHAMLSEHVSPEKLIANQTGGSTGEPVRFWLDRQRFEARVAGMIRHDRWAGHDIGCRAAYIWGAPRDRPSNRWKTAWRNRLLGGQLWLDASAITVEGLREFNQKLKKFRPHTIIAYANAIVMFARFIRESGLTAWQPNGIITSAELLTPSGRQIAEDVFGCPVFNRYGCREFSIVATECERHQGLHLMAEHLLIEIDSDDGHVADSGSILVTDLLNRAMPMIRYRIGDRAQFLEGDCPCGRGLPRLRSIDGRVTDFLVGDDEKLVSGVFLATYLVAQRPSLGQVQIIQNRAGHALFKLRPSAGFDKQSDDHYIIDTAKKYLGTRTIVEIEIVENFETTPSGKIPFSISRALPEFAAVNREQHKGHAF